MNLDSRTISEVTRRQTFDFLTLSGVDWSGRLAEVEFLSRLYDLTKLPSTDGRFHSADGDINQHRVNNNDWPDEWVFFDPRFNLLHGSDQVFLNFLCETVHPIVRPMDDQVTKLVNSYNGFLRPDGWLITETRQISGRPIFQAVRHGTRLEVFNEPTGWEKVDRQIQEAKQALNIASAEEHYQSVGLLCREALISVAEEVFDASEHSSPDAVMVSKTDARRMLEAFLEAEMQGGTNEESRAHAKAALRLALALQHKRTADFKTAALCCEATTSVVNLVAIVSGRRVRTYANE